MHPIETLWSQIRKNELGAKRIGPGGYSRVLLAYNGAVMFKLMAGPSSRYIAGNWRRWGAEWAPTVEQYLTDFFRLGKVFHEQRTAIKTRKPKVEDALKRQPVPTESAVDYVVETDGKGFFREIKRTIRQPKSYTVETYSYNYENEALELQLVTTSGNLKTIRL